MTFSTEKFYRKELDDLAKKTNLGENIDYGCRFIVARKNDKIIGATGINFEKNELPRFEHIIVSPEYQKTKLGGILMARVERWLIDLGYKRYIAFIFYGKDSMRHYAKKWGMIEDKQGIKGSWFYKNLIHDEEAVLC